MLQLGLSLAVTVALAEFKSHNCYFKDGFSRSEVICTGVLLMGILGVTVMRCSNTHPKIAFLILLVMTLLLLAGLLLTIISNYKVSTNCAYNEAFYRYYII